MLAIRPLGESGERGESVDAREDRREPDTIPGIGVSIDCNGRRVAADPYTGTVAAVLECASNLACVGAKPLGTTNNLNFGNPEKPHIAWQMTECVRGLGDACRALEAPIVGGNVSLYNESPPSPATAGPIYPTPVIGMVGSLPDVHRAGRLGFEREGDSIGLVGPFAPSLEASELAKLWGHPLPDGLAPIDIAAVAAAQAAVRDAVREGRLASAHDIAEGGLAVALAECCLAGGIGALIALEDCALEQLFGEGYGGFLVSGEEAHLRELAAATSVRILGRVGGDVLRIEVPTRARTGGDGGDGGDGGGDGGDDGEVLALTLFELAQAHNALAELFA